MRILELGASTRARKKKAKKKRKKNGKKLRAGLGEDLGAGGKLARAAGVAFAAPYVGDRVGLDQRAHAAPQVPFYFG